MTVITHYNSDEEWRKERLESVLSILNVKFEGMFIPL